MGAILARARRLVRRFAKGTRAVAAVEFALILPLLLTLYVGSVELSSAISVDKRVASVSGSLGDLVARANGTVSTSDVTDYFTAAAATMAPYSSAEVKQIVTCVRVDASGNSTVVWSLADNGAIKHIANAAYTLPTELKTMALNGYVIVSEAELSYTPLMGYFFPAGFTLYHEFYFLPRFGEAIALNPA